jgi:hypothetical protein
MPNRHITDQQVIRYMTSRFDNRTRAAAAAIAGFSERSARRIDKDPRFPSQKKQPRPWQIRQFAAQLGITYKTARLLT